MNLYSIHQNMRMTNLTFPESISKRLSAKEKNYDWSPNLKETWQQVAGGQAHCHNETLLLQQKMQVVNGTVERNKRLE